MKFLSSAWVVPFIVGAALAITPVAHAAEPACALEPLDLPLFGGTPVAQLVDPATPAAARDASESEIRTALEQFVACTNTGDPRLAWAVFSPRWFATMFADPTVHYLPAFERMLDHPAVVSGAPLELRTIEAITPLPDGRIEVTATFASGDEAWTDTLVLVLIDGTWLIDEVRPGSQAS